MSDQGRKVRFALTPLEAEAVAAFLASWLDPKAGGKDDWGTVERRRGSGVAVAALRRAAEKMKTAGSKA